MRDKVGRLLPYRYIWLGPITYTRVEIGRSKQLIPGSGNGNQMIVRYSRFNFVGDWFLIKSSSSSVTYYGQRKSIYLNLVVYYVLCLFDQSSEWYSRGYKVNEWVQETATKTAGEVYKCISRGCDPVKTTRKQRGIVPSTAINSCPQATVYQTLMVYCDANEFRWVRIGREMETVPTRIRS